MFTKIVIPLMMLVFLSKVCSGQDYIKTPFNSSSGLYYENVGKVLLSNNNWKFVTYVDYKGYLLFFEYLKRQASKLEDFCRLSELDYCKERLANIKKALGRIEDTDDTMADYLGIRKKSRRKRRFWFEIGSFLAGLGSSLVSVFTSSSSRPDMSYYDQQIAALKNGEREIIDRINLQTTIFMADAQKKNVKIEWLEKSQTEIQSEILKLHQNFTHDSKEKTEKINELATMLTETNNKLKKQAELQKKMSEKIDSIEKNLSSVEQKLNDLIKVVSDQGNTLNETNLKVELNTLTTDFNFLFDDFKDEQERLFYVIKRAKRGELDPYLLSPLNLVQMLQNIIPKILETERFPFYPSIENAHYLYNLITPDIYFHNYTLFFILEIPLVNIKSFDSYKITSLPFPIAQNVFAFILPKDPFLLVDERLQEYSTMSKELFEKCKEIDKSLFLCKQTQSLRSIHFEAICEVDLITSRNVPDTCNKRLMYLKDVLFLQLQKPYSWVYLSPTEASITVKCDSNRHNLLIEGSGFITLSSNSCKMKYKNYDIETIMSFTKSVKTNFTSEANLHDFIPSSEVDNVQLMVRNNQKYVILPFEFKALSDISIPVENKSIVLNYLYFLILLPVILIIVLIIYHKKVKLFLLNRNSTRNTRDDSYVTASYNTESREKLKFKLKANNKNERIDALSIKGTPSETDPDSEYLTVRVKVKKLKNRVATMIKSKRTNINNEYVATAPTATDLVENSQSGNHDFEEESEYGNRDVILQKEYLNELRKMKPGN